MNLKWQLQSCGGAEELAQHGSRLRDESCCSCSLPGTHSKPARMFKNGKEKDQEENSNSKNAWEY